MRSDGWFNTTILDLWQSDSGVYTCGGNSRHIFVFNATYEGTVLHFYNFCPSSKLFLALVTLSAEIQI